MAIIETSRTKIVARLEREGWELKRHGAKHDIYAKPGGPVVQVPRHRQLSIGVAREIAERAGWL